MDLLCLCASACLFTQDFVCECVFKPSEEPVKSFILRQHCICIITYEVWAETFTYRGNRAELRWGDESDDWFSSLLTFSPGGPIGPWGPIRPWKTSQKRSIIRTVHHFLVYSRYRPDMILTFRHLNWCMLGESSPALLICKNLYYNKIYILVLLLGGSLQLIQIC